MYNSILNLFKLEIDKNRVFGLDILRAFAILFVVYGHGRYLLPSKFISVYKLFTFDGVSIFFVLSGFLIGGILIKIIEKNEISKTVVLNFWIRRWFRTIPNYLLILSVLCLLHYFFTDNFIFWEVKDYFIFSQNLFYEHPASFFPEAWSLSVEEWFYLLVPIIIFGLIWMFKILPRYALLITAVLLITIITLIRYNRYLNIDIQDTGQWALIFRNQVITRLDSIMFGTIGAYISFYYNEIWLKFKKPLLLMGLLLIFTVKCFSYKIEDAGSLYNTVFSFSIISVATLLLLPFLSDFKKGIGKVYKFITYISLSSYSMYLLNLSVIQHWILNKIPWSVISNNLYIVIPTKYVLFWGLAFLLSILLYKYFELPMTKLRDNKKLGSVIPNYEKKLPSLQTVKNNPDRLIKNIFDKN